MLIINEERLLKRIHTLGAVGLDADGRRTRLAASDDDKAWRDLVARWMSEAGLTVVTDYIGNLFGIWVPEGCADAAPPPIPPLRFPRSTVHPPSEVSSSVVTSTWSR